jgi:nicotinic acid mononucleotide adenylyltransferase
VVSDSEVDRGEAGEVGYMVDTIDEAIEIPSLLGFDDLTVDAALVVGADQVATLPQWNRYDQLIQRARIAVVGRPLLLDDDTFARQVEALRRAGARVDVVDMAPVAISSTLVREAAAHGDRDAVEQLVPTAIVDDVLHLYGPAVRA